MNRAHHNAAPAARVPHRVFCPQAFHRAVMFAAAAGAIGMSPVETWAAQPTAQVVRHAKSRILIQPRAGLSNDEFDKILKPHGGRRVARIHQINVHVIELPAQASEVAVVNALRGNPHVKFAELDMVVDPILTPNDPNFGNAWHLPKIGAPSAWDVKTGTGVTIAILDSGVDGAHPELAAQMVPGWNTYDGNNNTADVHGHGTIIAGIAGAAGNNSAGSAGVSFGAKIMPIRITDMSGYGYYSTMASGITWAADRGARVANISFQGASAGSSVVSAAQYMRSKGGVVVTASGNTGGVESYAPTDYITVVSATDSSNAVTSFSSYGPFVDVAAPGVGIYSTTRGGGYTTGTGTSASSPVVAGVYALMISANPLLSSANLDNILFTTAMDIGAAGKDDKSGYGMVNANSAVTRAVQTTASDATSPSVSIGSPSAGTKVAGLVAVGIGATDNVGVSRVELHVNGSLYATDAVSPFGFSWDTIQLPDGPATLVAKAYDAAGNVGTSSTISVTVANDTTPPQVQIQSPGNGAVLTGSVTVSATATDNNKVSSMSLRIDGKEVAKSYSSSISYSWNTGASTKGGKKTSSTSPKSRSIQVIATDPAANQGTQSISVTTQ